MGHFVFKFLSFHLIFANDKYKILYPTVNASGECTKLLYPTVNASGAGTKLLYPTVNASGAGTKFCTTHLTTYPDVMHKVAYDAILIQIRCVQSVVSLEKEMNKYFVFLY